MKIRNARASDAAFLAWIIQESDRGHVERGTWDIVLPFSEEQRLAHLGQLATASVRSFCHYAGFLVAEVEGRTAAALCGYVPRDAGIPQLVEALREVFGREGWTNARIHETIARFRPALTCMPETAEDAWVIEWVATRPEYRGRGIAAALLEKILDRGRRAGHSVSQISLLIGNDPARRAYERAGFEFVDEKRHPEFEAAFGAPGVARLTRRL